jgi:hypothetical protein
VEICYLYGQSGGLKKVAADVQKLIRHKDEVENAYALVFMWLKDWKGNTKNDYDAVISQIGSQMLAWQKEINLRIYCILSDQAHSPIWF